MNPDVPSLDEGTRRTGLAVSGAMHFALLAVLAFGFARAPRFDDAPESIPVETITTTQLNEIMEGEKTGKPAPAPAPAPQPPTKPAPAPPEPPKPEPPAPQPPTRPEPRAPEPPAPEPPKRPDPPKPVDEDAPSPPTRPRPEKAEDTPRPPERTRAVKLDDPKPPERPKPKAEETPKPDKFKPDEIAKALAKEKSDDKPKPKAFDPTAISKLIGQTKTAELSPHQATPLGLANHHSAHMSVSLENALNEWFRDSYKNCWNLPPSNPAGENYVFDVRVTFNADGSLAGRPVLLNPPHEPEWQAHADSVMRAVMRCNPLHVPSAYAPFFDQWRSKTIHFDPASAEG